MADCIDDLFETRLGSASSAKDLLEFMTRSPCVLSEWVDLGGDLAALLGRIGEAIEPAKLKLVA